MSSNEAKPSTSGAAPGRTGQRVFMNLHSFLYRLTGGAIGGRMFNGDVLLLVTTGRKTGKRRTTPLLYIADGDNLAIIASNGGSDRPPTWWLNLQRSPEAQVQIRRKVMRVRAEQAGPEDKRRLWAQLAKVYPTYDEYQRKTSREIPVVVLKPL